MNPIRLFVVLALLFLFALAKRLYRQWRARLGSDARPTPPLPAALLERERNWVVFTTPYCATCGPVTDTLRRFDPDAGVVTVDATREPHLARAFNIRSAPTALLAYRDGHVRARLVGSDAVTRYYVRNPA